MTLKVRRSGVSRFKRNAFATVSSTALALSAIAMNAPAYAQAQPAQTAQAGAVEEIVVTGTRVQRDGYEAPTPLTVVGVEQLQSSATNNVADYVNNIPAFAGSRTPATTQSSMSAGTSGANVINLRNLGLNRTLVLLDGQRSVASNADGTVDVNTFPQALISRVDVVTGGASAAYGSDALAGVVNFVLDKKFTGVKGEVSGGVTTYGDNRQWNVSLTAGTPFAGGRGHFIVSGEASHQDGVAVNNRPWNMQGWEVITNPNYGTGAGQSTSVPQRLLKNQVSVAVGINGSIIPYGPLKGIAFGPGGTPYQFAYGSIFSDPIMVGGQWQASTIRGTNLANGLTSLDTSQHLFTRASYEITDNVEVFAQASWSHDYNHNWCCAAEDNADIDILSGNPFIPASVQSRMTALGLTLITIGSMNGDLGAAGANNDRRVQRFVVGGTGKFDAFDSNWTWNASAQIGVARAHEQVSDAPQVSHLYDLAMDAVRGPNGQIMCRSTLTSPNDGCVPYNPFGVGVNSAAAVRYALGSGGVDFRDQRFVQRVYSISANGEPFSSWAGPVSVAAGVEHRKDSAAGITDPIGANHDWLYGNYRPLNASNHVTEGYIETVIPLAKDTVWAKALDLNAAIRGTDYSTSGYVTTWKVGATWDVIDDLRLRATRSRDIRAPNLTELFSLGGGGPAGYINPFRGGVSETFGYTSNQGNPALVPETSNYTGVGAVLHPVFFPGFSASVDYWNMSIDKAIGSLSVQQVIDQCYSGNTQLCSALTFGAGNTITKILQEPFNLVSQVVRGLDIEASYRTSLDNIVSDWNGNVTARFLATNFLKFRSSNGINTPLETAGVNSDITNAVPNWRWNADLAYSNDTVLVDLGARGVSGGVYNTANIECTSGCPVSTADHRTVDNNHIDGAVYFDASFTYKFGVGDTATEAFLNIRNLMNKDPAVAAPGPGGYTYEASPANGQLYDVLGRVFRAGVRFKM